MNTPEEYIAAMQPKLCINCKHIGRNGSGDALKFKCFAAGNIRCEKIDLVTGNKYNIVRHETCYLARNDYADLVDSCGTEGKWFEPAPPRIEEPSRIDLGRYAGTYGGTKPTAPTAADLLSQLDKML